ncbi:MAG TPA: lysophospholipid acyltransferase family protein [Phycisphaerae bacterium]|nr:lysophospholipid acyltransferase family protein [Phycisphaerae bacterium]
MSESAAEREAAGETDVRQRWGVPRFGYYSNLAMLWIGSRVLWAGYFLVWFGAIYFFVFVRQARRASMAYLDRLRPGRSRLRRWWDTYRHMIEFGMLLLDRAVMLVSPRHGFEMRCDGREHLTRAMAQGRGVIMLTAHFGNAEAAAPNIFRMGVDLPIHIVMYQESSDATERFHTKHRRMLSNMNVISTTDPLVAGVKIIAALRKGDVVAMRADRALTGKAVRATLLGAEVELPAGPFMAAALSGAPVVNVYTCRLGYRRYACVISEMRLYGDDQPGTGEGREERVARAAQDFAECLEGLIRKYPLQWGNFYDLWAKT